MLVEWNEYSENQGSNKEGSQQADGISHDEASCNGRHCKNKYQNAPSGEDRERHPRHQVPGREWGDHLHCYWNSQTWEKEKNEDLPGPDLVEDGQISLLQGDQTQQKQGRKSWQSQSLFDLWVIWNLKPDDSGRNEDFKNIWHGFLAWIVTVTWSIRSIGSIRSFWSIR